MLRAVISALAAWPRRASGWLAQARQVAGLVRPAALAGLVTALASMLAVGCGPAAAGQPQPAGAGRSLHPAVTASGSAPVLGPQLPASSPSAPRTGHVALRLEQQLPSRINNVALAKASTTGAAIFTEFGDTAWAGQMTKYLASVGKTPADLRYAQVWDPSGAVNLDAGVFQASGITAAALRKAIINSSVPDSPNLTTSASTIAGKAVTVVVNGNSGSALYLYDHDSRVFYIGGSDAGLVAEFLRLVP